MDLDKSADQGEKVQGHAIDPGSAAGVYRVADWGGQAFGVNEHGHLVAGTSRLDLLEIVEGLRERGITTPVVLRLSELLEDRVRSLHEAFRKSIAENEYEGSYRAVFPIKVNQQHQLIEEVSSAGAEYGLGLEVGSKPELLAVMALTSERTDQLILCNGFKDARYIEAVVLSAKLGREIVPIVESVREARLIVDASKKYGVRPQIGVRVKLASRGAGRWSDSAGVKSKFGLFVSEVLEMITMLEQEGMLDCLKLLHCHPGSQIQDIRKLKGVVNELSHVYVGLVRRGAGLTMLDIGGGLGVDYRGVQSNSESSMNYSLSEFASDVVYRVKSVCDEAGVKHPTIITECGRAMVAESSVLIFDVLGATGPARLAAGGDAAAKEIVEASPQPLWDLAEALSGVSGDRYMEAYHDAVQARDEAMSLFSLGYLSLDERAIAERLFWTVCARVHDTVSKIDPSEVPEELWGLGDLLCDIYFGNFSVFQSLPDAWAIDQLFPVMPIHRLDELPTRRAILADITCDSDGQLANFIGGDEPERTLPVHELRQGEAYYIGVFFVGAYQETLGDLHNLFGDAHVVHVKAEDGSWAIEEIVQGDTAREVLSYVQHDPEGYAKTLSRECERATRKGMLTVPEARVLQWFYETGLSGYTYLDNEDITP